MKTHTKESLAALSRNQLVKVAKKHGIREVEGVHYTRAKSLPLIEAILEAQPAVHSVMARDAANTEKEIAAGGSTQVIDVKPAAVAVAGEDEGGEDGLAPVVPFDAETEQTEIPTPPEKEQPSKGIFKVSRKVFLLQLAALAKVIDPTAKMAILGTTLISFGKGKLRVEGTNLDVHVATQVPAETTEEFSLAVPYGVLSKFVAKCSSEFLMAEVKGHRIYLSDLENRTEIMTISADEFPPAPQAGITPVLEINSNRLIGAINETLKCASTDDTRYILFGLHLDVRQPDPVVVATDGRRIVRTLLLPNSVSPVDLKDEFAGKFIIPSRGCEAIRASVPKETLARVSRTENNRLMTVRAELNGLEYQLTTKLIEGNYPVYQQVIPKDGVYQEVETYQADRLALLAALGRIMVLNSEKANSIKLTFTANLIKIAVLNTSVGQGAEKLKVVGPGVDKPVITALNPLYLAEILASWADEKVTVAVKDELSPVLLRAEGKIAVIMPCRMS